MSSEVAGLRPVINQRVSSSHSSSCNSHGLTCFSCPFIPLIEIPHTHQNLSCTSWIRVSGITIAIATTAATGDSFQLVLPVKNNQRFTALLTLRVVALYRNVRWLVGLVWVSFVIFQGLSVTVYIRCGIALYGELTIGSCTSRLTSCMQRALSTLH